MKIVIIGSGNVAFHLTQMLVKTHQKPIQIFGRNEKSLKEISEIFSIPFSINKLEDADLYIISTSDTAVEEISLLIKKTDALVVHTAGSLPMEILKGNYAKGVVYPLQTFSKNKNLDYEKISFFLETENEKYSQILYQIFNKVSPKVSNIDFQSRKFLHLTAVFTCNFVNHLLACGKEIADSQNISFQYFLPLIEETIQKIYHLSPKDAQTGPAIRNDKKILENHKNLLQNFPDFLKIYEILTNSIIKMHQK